MSPRQRLGVRRGAIAGVALRFIVVILVAALVWFGAMTILAGVKLLGPHELNALTGDRTIFTKLTHITSVDITSGDRIIVAIVGVICLVVFGPLAWRAVPRPYLTRHALELPNAGGPGQTAVAPRAIERVIETSALSHDSVDAAAGRYRTDRLTLFVSLGGTTQVEEALRSVQLAARQAITDHDLPALPVDIVLARYVRSNP